ncbi:alkaline phosphatase [Pedobacter sp.]|jgi:predicted AlkP superfamily pyrophosphatase or phosphodiesterase|uniref:alkaline phosphatase n=1 Tax=Pedobacter sp. TaxID=1411316 RepID=UPI002C12849D|nr:alkaline phosphatase [Pedobacter sp.]HWW38079.1 alkaline phosphatase [Pedobacter sp.]
MKNYLKITMFLLCLSLTAGAQLKKIKHVVLIGCDGFGGYALNEANMPNLKAMMANGSWTAKARCVLPSSSAVNWASLLMGAGPTEHGYTEWDSKTPEIPSVTKTGYDMFPGIFSVVRDQKKDAKTAIIYSWGGIAHLFERQAVNIIVDGKDKDDFCADTTAAIIRREKPLFTFLHLDEPDGTGHNIGHRTPAYYKQLELVDQRIGKIIKAVKDAGIADETIILVTADHGGTGKGHGGKSLDEVQIPWIISGPGVRKNHEIKNVIITYDTAATLAWIMGLTPPQSWRGQPVKEAFVH